MKESESEKEKRKKKREKNEFIGKVFFFLMGRKTK